MRVSHYPRPRILNILSTCYRRRTILTLAIETSCDDTSVAILEKDGVNEDHRLPPQPTRTKLHYHQKVTSDNRAYGGVHPIVAVESHQQNLSTLVKASLASLPIRNSSIADFTNAIFVEGELRKKPDFITVTRGPGMRSSLQCGIDTAKGLAVGWQIPILGVNHMQAHAITPRLVSSMAGVRGPDFPFMTLLVSGGNTMLVRSAGLCDHRILAETSDMAVGDVLDKCARDILPAEVLKAGSSVMYGRLLEQFAFENEPYNYIPPGDKKESDRTRRTHYGWAIPPPFCSETGSGEKRNAMEYSFSNIGSTVKRITKAKPEMDVAERRLLARETMRIAFEHLFSRLFMALGDAMQQEMSTVVVSGGVASNMYLRHMLRATLDARKLGYIQISSPPVELCTDNAAMIAWTGIEMWEAGWRSKLDVTAIKKWSVDSGNQGGILAVEGWINVL